MSSLRHAESVVIQRSPEDLYDMVSDVTRMGEWSPGLHGLLVGRGRRAVAGGLVPGRW